MVQVKQQYLIDRQGKTFALYSGLLDAAHEAGLRAIRTELVQAPTKENGDTTIVAALVEMEDGRVFAGLGDANPQNVGRNIAAHSIRMAETRAKARALRDAINVGGAALEELGDDDDPPAYQPRSEQRPAVKTQADSPLRQECRDVMARMRAINPATTVQLPPEDAPNSAFNLWLDDYRPKLEAAERRAQTATQRGR
jgi:hypothetical protein